MAGASSPLTGSLQVLDGVGQRHWLWGLGSTSSAARLLSAGTTACQQGQGGGHRRTAAGPEAPGWLLLGWPSGTGPHGHPAGIDAPVRGRTACLRL